MLVLWANAASTNLGVRVLAEGAAALASSVDPRAEVSFYNFGSSDGPRGLGRPRDVAVELATGRRGFRRWAEQFDLALDTRSGDSFADIYGLRRHVVMSGIGELVARAGVAQVMLPQTIGPFQTRRGRALARRTLRQAGLVMTRDPLSAEHSLALGRRPDLLTTDLAFALDEQEPTDTRDVLLNISGLLWGSESHVDSRQYRSTVDRVYHGLRDRGRVVSLLAHVISSDHPDNDVPAAQDFAAGLDHDVEIVEPASLADARRVIAGAHLVVGSRMHACLNALSLGVPAIALAYSRKFAPLMTDLGWPCCVDLGSDQDADHVLAVVDERDWVDDARAVQARGRERLADAAALLGSTIETWR